MKRAFVPKAQGAKGYLMTCGWAILTIAVVLSALFGLGAFSSGSLVSTACVPSPGHRCPVQSIFLKSFQTIAIAGYVKAAGMKKSLVPKAQGAMEFMMTYGWAILIISVIIGVLFGLGVFNSGSLVSTACVPASGFQCTGPSLLTTGVLTLTYGQNTGVTEYNSFVTVAAQGAVLNSAGFPTNTLSVSNPLAYPATPVGPTYISGSSNTLTFQLTPAMVPPGGYATLGGAFSGVVWVNYSTASGGPAIVATKVAKLTAKVV
jgi:hypothetical protein